MFSAPKVTCNVGYRKENMNDSVKIYQSANEAWKLGFLGFFVRVRGMLITAAVTLATMGSPWWWPKQLIPAQLPTISPLYLAFVILLFGALAIVTMFYLRKRSVRSLNIKMHLHNIAHELRDQQTRLYRKIMNKHLWDSDALTAFANSLCDQIKPFFTELTYDSTIETAIRLAEEVEDEDGLRIIYKTYGRSSGLDKSRNCTSESIKSTEGIPHLLNESHKCKVVLKLNDIEEASKCGAFKKTKNEEKFPHEIATLFATPINAWDGKKESMIGILYITSRKKKSLHPKHIDSVRFLADQIAPHFAFSAQEIKANLKK
jgi:hypothetical protein